MLRKTLAATPKQRDRAEPPEGQPEQGSPTRSGRQPEEAGTSRPQRLPELRGGRAGGLPWGALWETRAAIPGAASMRQPGPGRAARLQSPQREDSALELHKEDRRRQGKRLQEVQTPGGRATRRGQNPRSDTRTLTKLESNHLLKREGEEQTREEPRKATQDS